MSVNILSRYSKGKRSLALQKYFKYMGLIPSALFGGVLTTMMISNTLLISNEFNIENKWYQLILSFIIGVIWGIVGHYSKGMKPFKIFYDNTSGYIESRFWDGIAIPFALGIVFIIKNFLK